MIRKGDYVVSKYDLHFLRFGFIVPKGSILQAYEDSRYGIFRFKYSFAGSKEAWVYSCCLSEIQELV